MTRENFKLPGEASERPCVLLLQGPVGPFFSQLQAQLDRAGYDVHRVTFNAADRLFSHKKSRTHFFGSPLDWEVWLREYIAKHHPQCIVLFGSSRPTHKIARSVAMECDVNVLSLEEGYLRNGYVTAEFGGNNQHSPLTSWRPGVSTLPLAGSVEPPLMMRSSFVIMSFWGAIYYLLREMNWRSSNPELLHRPRSNVLGLSWSWCVHMMRRAKAHVVEAKAIKALTQEQNYILVPLQVSNDSQIQLASRGWTTPKLIDACLSGLNKSNRSIKVVFKLHPLEKQNAQISQLIAQKVSECSLDLGRVQVIHTGKIGELAEHSQGMVVINSTSAFSALHSNVPLLVLGDAIYRHDELATVGSSEQDVVRFFERRSAKPSELVDEFFVAIKAQSLVPGDFYAAVGRKVAVQNIIKKIDALRLAPSKTLGGSK